MQLLGPLTLQNGTITYTYPGDKTHSNLLTKIQGFSITQESSGSTPQTPSNQTVYQAQFDTNTQSLPQKHSLRHTRATQSSKRGY